MSKKRPPCPKCQSKKFVPIHYGMPLFEIHEKSKLDKLVLGGCCFSNDSPKWHCQVCGHEFGELFNTEDLPLSDAIKPLKLEFTIGGFDLLERYCVRLENSILKYGMSYGQGFLEEKVAVIPTDKKWLNFKKKLDTIGVWKWKKNYINKNVCDGTQWELELDYGLKKIKVYGSNKYPGSTDQTDLRETPEFKALLHALKLLLGGVKIV